MCEINAGLNIPLKKERDDYDKILNDIKTYNRADTVNMSEAEMNKFRHIAGPAYLANQNYSKEKVNLLGFIKEVKDLFQGRGLSDTKYDWQNNQKGISIGINAKKKMNQKDLFDYIFKTEILPYRK